MTYRSRVVDQEIVACLSAAGAVAIEGRMACGKTGSAVPADDVTRHTGAGRILRVRMRPMSLLESGRSSGAVSLARLMRGEMDPTPDPGLTVSELATEMAVGGWPGVRTLPAEAALRAMRAYGEAGPSVGGRGRGVAAEVCGAGGHGAMRGAADAGGHRGRGDGVSSRRRRRGDPGGGAGGVANGHPAPVSLAPSPAPVQDVSDARRRPPPRRHRRTG